MWVNVKLESNLAVGTVIKYDGASQLWTTANDGEGLIGVIRDTPFQDEETLEWFAKTVFAGTAYAIADQSIPDQGGEFIVINGRVYVGESTECGIIAPLPRGQSSRVADELVMVHIR